MPMGVALASIAPLSAPMASMSAVPEQMHGHERNRDQQESPVLG